MASPHTASTQSLFSQLWSFLSLLLFLCFLEDRFPPHFFNSMVQKYITKNVFQYTMYANFSFSG